MLKIAYSWLLNAQIAHTAIWIAHGSYIFHPQPAAWLRSSRARHGALTGRRITGASFCNLTRDRPSAARAVGGSSAGLPPFSPAAGAGEAGACGGTCGAGAALLNSSPLPTRLLPGWSERRLRSPDAPSKRQCRHRRSPAF